MSFTITKVFSQHGKIAERWMFDVKSPLMCAASVATVGGKQFVIAGTKQGSLMCVDEDGKQVWTFGMQEKLGEVESFFVDETRLHSVDAPPLIADVNMDGLPEIIVGTERGTIYCLNMKGELLWKHSCGDSIKASAMIADINMDGKPEIVIGSSNRKLTVLTGEGKVVFEYLSDAPIESTPGLLKGKRNLIVFGNNKGTLTAITASEDMIWKADLQDKITAAPAFFSVPGEARMAVGTHGGNMFCVSENGEVLWHYQTKGSIYSAAVIADLNNDQQPEIIFGSCDNNIYALTSTGKRFWNYETDFWITTTPIVHDIDADGKLEVVAGSYDHNVYILDSEGSYLLDYVPGLSGIVNQAGHYSNLLTSDPGELTGKKLYQFKTNGIVVGCSLLHRETGKPTLIVSTKPGTISDLAHEE